MHIMMVVRQQGDQMFYMKKGPMFSKIAQNGTQPISH